MRQFIWRLRRRMHPIRTYDDIPKIAVSPQLRDALVESFRYQLNHRRSG